MRLYLLGGLSLNEELLDDLLCLLFLRLTEDADLELLLEGDLRRLLTLVLDRDLVDGCSLTDLERDLETLSLLLASISIASTAESAIVPRNEIN